MYNPDPFFLLRHKQLFLVLVIGWGTGTALESSIFRI
jgi:hypothetical protein